jgi:hypothetical protein
VNKRKTSSRPWRIILFFLLLSACATPAPPGESVRRFGDSPHALAEPFLSAWRNAGGERLGPPRSAAIWLDGRKTQLFDTVRLEAGGLGGVAVERQPENWQQAVPPPLFGLEAAPQQASITVGSSQLAVGQRSTNEQVIVQPLQPLQVNIEIEGYSGPLELRLFDAGVRPAGVVSGTAQAGTAALELLPRGVLGSQWALLLVDGKLAGASSNLFTLDAETALQTGVPDLDLLYPKIRAFMEQCVTSYELDGFAVRGYRSPDNPLLWLRDHVYQGRGFRYFERDVTSLLDAFRRAQRADGSFPDVIDYPERFVKAVRKDPESDLEFLFVQGVHEAWQMTGNEAILRDNLDAMRRGLRYITSDPLRWDAGFGLVRRPYTIDTWDFEFGPTTTSPDGKPAPRHWIDERTQWGIFHGDNTGLAYAMRLMADIEERLGDREAAGRWRAESLAIMQRLNELAWNGRFFTHFILAEGPRRGQLPEVAGVDTGAQLSLSNAWALNRGNVLEFGQGQAIVQSYFERRDFSRAFAEWYSIDPPFPPGSYGMGGRPGDDPGEYVNGGIMPLTGGELARGAFRYGAEGYGFDMLRRYASLIRLTGESYLWYYPDGRPGISGPDTIPTDGWGSSAMLGALLEGAAGVVDRGSRFNDLALTPRWTAAPEVRNARVVARYATSDGYVAYTWSRGERSLKLDLTGTWEETRIRLLLPEGTPDTLSVTLDGAPVQAEIERVAGSRYLRLPASGGNAMVEVRW